MLQLVLHAIGVGQVAVQVARLGPQWLEALAVAFLVATGALVGIGHLVVHHQAVALLVMQGQRRAGARPLQDGFLLGVVPHIGQRHPALSLAHQHAGLHQAHPLQRQPLGRVAVVPGVLQQATLIILRVIEGLGEHGADGKVERLLAIAGALPRRQPEGAQLVGVVAEQRGVEVVGQGRGGRLQVAVGALEHAPATECFRVGLAVWQVERLHWPVAAGQQQEHQAQRDSHEPFCSPALASTTSGNGGSVQRWALMSVLMFLKLFGPSTLTRVAAPLSTQMPSCAGSLPSTSFAGFT
ncbi:hypothetical protein FQZ97_839560 [compost metagenome]